MGNFFKKIPGYHLVAKMSETSEEIRKAGRNVSSCVFEDNHLSDPYILLQNKGMSSRDYEFNADGSIISLKKLFVLPDILLSQFNQSNTLLISVLFSNFNR